MPTEQLELRKLRIEDKDSFRDAVYDFSKLDSDMTFAFQYEKAVCFKEYVEIVNSWPEGKNLLATYVPNTFFVGIVKGKVIGRLSIRHKLNDFLKQIGGHIGYCVIPSQQKHGYATEMLKQSLDYARLLGLDKVLITCDTDNIGSMNVIKNNDGVYENTSDDPNLKIQKNRYWIDLYTELQSKS